MKLFRHSNDWVEVPFWADHAEIRDNPAFGKNWFCSTHNVVSLYDDLEACLDENCRVEVFLTDTCSNMYPVSMVYVSAGYNVRS